MLLLMKQFVRTCMQARCLVSPSEFSPPQEFDNLSDHERLTGFASTVQTLSLSSRGN